MNFLTSLAVICLCALLLGSVLSKIKLPPLLGMLVVGIVLGPYVLDLIAPSILGISADFRQLALIIILARAGLNLNLKDLKKNGVSAVLMCFVPATAEILGYMLLGTLILKMELLDAALLFRMAGVFLCVCFSKLNMKERLFCMIAYSPKATEQAAIGAIPLTMGLACGQTILTAAVLAIIITAPLGAFLTDLTYKNCLQKGSSCPKSLLRSDAANNKSRRGNLPRRLILYVLCGKV